MINYLEISDLGALDPFNWMFLDVLLGSISMGVFAILVDSLDALPARIRQLASPNAIKAAKHAMEKANSSALHAIQL